MKLVFEWGGHGRHRLSKGREESLMTALQVLTKELGRERQKSEMLHAQNGELVKELNRLLAEKQAVKRTSEAITIEMPVITQVKAGPARWQLRKDGSVSL